MLYGDGIHDDALEIQNMLDSGVSAVRLPLPAVCYMISRPLRIHSRQQFILDRFCRIRLMDGSNCHMLQNADMKDGDTDIEVVGGIWDSNNLGQSKNPFLFSHDDFPNYDGMTFFFQNVTRLRIAGLTMKDPVTFAITLNIIRYFTVENIDFDFNYGNPYAVNMDGVHLDGNCRFGVIRNIKGSCYDDMIALNADEGTPGPIADILVDGIMADDCHSAVRLLSSKYPVERVHISNVFGSYYQYCIGFTKDCNGKCEGCFDSVRLSNIHASKAPRYSVYHKDGGFVYPFIWVENNVVVRNLHIEDVYRKENNVPIETVGIDPKAHVENLTINNVVFENRLEHPVPVVWNKGTVDRLHIFDIRSYDDEKLKNEGTIKTLIS